MIKMFFGVLLTFVLGVHTAFAAPYSNPEEQDEVIVEEESSEKPDFEAQNLVPSQPTDLNVVQKPNTATVGSEEYFFPYTQSLSLRSGVLLDLEELTNSPNFEYILGVSYMFPSYYSPHWEVGVDMASTGEGHLSGGIKVTLNEKGSYRPFYKVGAMHKWDPDDRLVSFTDWENYLIQASFGFEDMIKAPQSVRLEIEGALGANDYLVFLVAGVSWGF